MKRGRKRVMLGEEFVGRGTAEVARGLLGKWLVCEVEGRRVARRIVEVEAYHGEEDEACHASKGRTKRTEVMFGAGGKWYVYLCYGVHEMLNLVTGPEGFAAAVLIRGVEGVEGPGRVTKFFGIDRRFNGKAAGRGTGLWIEEDGVEVPAGEVVELPRVGIDYAGREWREKLWRFVWRRGAAE